MPLTMDDIKRVFNEAQKQRLDIFLEVTQPDSQELSLMYAKHNKLETMLEFIKKNYNHNLINKDNEEIKIVNIKVWRN